MYHSMYLMTIIMFSWRRAEEFCPSLEVSKLSSSAQGPGLGQSCGSGWLHQWSSLAGPAAVSRRLGRAHPGQGRACQRRGAVGMQSQAAGIKEQSTVFSRKKTPQLAKLPYQDFIIADTRQGGVSHKTFVGRILLGISI